MLVQITREREDLRGLLARSQFADEPIIAGATLRGCLKTSSHIWIGRYDGKIICASGLIPPSLMSYQAFIWMLHDKNIGEHKFLLIRYSQRIVEEMLKSYNLLVGSCKAADEGALKWLKWLGAEFDSAPINGMLPFKIRKK